MKHSIITILSLWLVGCTQVKEEASDAADFDETIYIGKLDGNNGVFEEDDPQSYFVNSESITANHVRDNEEESFQHEADLLNFERNDTEFEYTYMNFKDGEIKKSYEIKSRSIVEDEKGVWYEWWGPEELAPIEDVSDDK